MKLKRCNQKTKTLLCTLFLFVATMSMTQAQNIINGTVLDETGMPLPGASVILKGTNNGTSTDFDGKFSMNITKDDTTLEVSYVGYITKEVAVSNQPLTITLQSDVKALDEVVVTALGIKREQKALGYSVQEIKGETLQKVSGVDIGTSLSGKVAGLLVNNSTDFNVAPEITIRGEEPLLVIDGIAYENRTLSDISSEDVESMSILKGATASALYGFRGANGAILITTKNGSTGDDGFSVGLTTNTMYSAGFLAIPERQSVYGRGTNNTYNINTDESWGQVMDGSMQTQWDPIAKEFSEFEYIARGKDNFNNFLEQGYITNNNISLAFKEDKIALRSSINWIEQKGQYPNSKLNKYTYSFGGDVNLDKFKLSSNLSYSKRESPNMGTNGYTSYDPMYSLLIWSPLDWDVRDYKDNIWLIPGEVQNNHYGYDFENNRYSGKPQNNPYFDRYQKINEVSRDIFNADITMSYDVNPWLKATLRSGLDFFVDRGQLRISQGSKNSSGNATVAGIGTNFNGTNTGAYITGRAQGFSINNDLLLSGDQKFIDDKLEVEYLAGGTIYYQRNDNLAANTVGGISIPEFFSLNASVNPASVKESLSQQQVNSAFGRLGLSWDKLIYVDVTARNDWSSTLTGPGVEDSKKSYFYPSFSGSFVVSELIKESTRDWLDLLKIRSSWTKSKKPAGIYDINSVFSTSPGTWNDLNGASAPNNLYDLSSISPESANTFEMGLQAMFLKKRLTVDVSYYNKHMYDFLQTGALSATSGYTGVVLNKEDEIDRKGWEVAISATPIKTDNLRWDLGLNWSTYKDVYAKIDQTYTQNDSRPWIKVGERTDHYVGNEFMTDPTTGQHVYSNGRIVKNPYSSVYGYSNPDWIWGANSTLTYKDFSLFLSFDGLVGGLSSSRTESYMWQSGVHPDSVTPERALDVATPGSSNYIGDGVMVTSGTVEFDTDGTILSDTRVFETNTVATTYLRAAKDLHASSAWGGTGTTTDAFSRTYLKLREISLSYQIPSKLLNGWGAKKASISLIGQNVLLWAKDYKYSDPDNSVEDFADPSVRYLGANLKLSF